jgi:hypothetical protein
MDWDLICPFPKYHGEATLKNEMETSIWFSAAKYQAQCLVQSWHSVIDSHCDDYNYNYDY